MLINIEDLMDIEDLKQALTVKTILFRSAYSQDYLSCKRKASICLSTGDIKGLTGRYGDKLRRLIVIPVNNIAYNLEMDIDNLYSQAVNLIKGGDRISITPKTFPVKGDFSQGIDRIIK
jgi:predicted P-loop ATPase